MRYQLRHAPRLRQGLYRRHPCASAAPAQPRSRLLGVPLVALFALITVGFGAIAVWSAEASRWPIAAAAAALAAWMASLAWAALRKQRP